MIPAKPQSLIILLFLSSASILTSLCKGSTSIDNYQLFNTILGHGTSNVNDIIWNVRLPRTLSAFVTGALLALSGAIMQILLRNPLADPYVLGISGGAGVMSLLFILCGFSGIMLTLGAWCGSLMAVFLVFAFIRHKNAWQSEQVLLTGIALASGFSAIMSFILVTSSDRELHSMLYWLLGDLSDTHLPIFESLILLLALGLSIFYSKELNVLMRGIREAEALGISTQKLFRQLYFLCAFLTAAAVGLAGCIGFVGLIIPHLFRKMFGTDHRFLLPGSALLGGSLLTMADTLSRTIFLPEELPVGMVMALIGIPIFIFLLQKNRA